MIYKGYEVVIGLEVHVQLSTISKMFCSDANSFGEESNTHISAISLAHPGTLPRVNHQAIDSGLKVALAIGAKVNKENRFDRKHYFYPDLPKAYQITQDNLPICVGGSLFLSKKYDEKLIRFHHVHMEEDAGKSLHHLDQANSFIDLNRAGVPLLEMVTEPDLRSGDEVLDFMARLQQMVRYIGISDANMEEGSMRCDCNVSVRKEGSTTLGQRCEIKNMNSKKFAKQAVEYEAKRQVDLILDGGSIKQSTLHFNPETGRTSPSREKEDAHDYRYLPDPDLPPILITDEHLQQIEQQMNPLPDEMREILVSDHKLSLYQADQISADIATASYFRRLDQQDALSSATANFVINRVLPYINEQGVAIEEYPIQQNNIRSFLELIANKKVVQSTAYSDLLPAMIERQASPASLVEELGLGKTDDTDALSSMIRSVIEQNPDEHKSYLNGKKKLMKFFIGQAMRESKGKFSPGDIQKALTEQLK